MKTTIFNQFNWGKAFVFSLPLIFSTLSTSLLADSLLTSPANNEKDTFAACVANPKSCNMTQELVNLIQACDQGDDQACASDELAAKYNVETGKLTLPILGILSGDNLTEKYSLEMQTSSNNMMVLNISTFMQTVAADIQGDSKSLNVDSNDFGAYFEEDDEEYFYYVPTYHVETNILFIPELIVEFNGEKYSYTVELQKDDNNNFAIVYINAWSGMKNGQMKQSIILNKLKKEYKCFVVNDNH